MPTCNTYFMFFLCTALSTNDNCTSRCARLFTLWTKLLPTFLAVVLSSCFVLGTTLVLPELLSGAPLVASCVVAAALFLNILFNLAAAVLRSPGTPLAYTLSLELAFSLLQFVSCKSVGVYSMQ